MFLNYLLLCRFFTIFALRKRNMGSCRFDRDTHQIKSKTEQTSLVDGGPRYS
jgi:hypothetical protein